MDERFDNMDERLTRVESQMVTKDYLDSKLSDLRGDLVVLTRKEDTKLKTLVNILGKRKVISNKDKEIRKVIYNDEWWFSVVDVIGALTDSVNSRDYWYKMKIRVEDESEMQLSTICRQLKLESSDGKKYATDCANTEGVSVSCRELSHFVDQQ